MPTYPKILKPWRGFPNFNGVHEISVHINQASPTPGLGQIALTNGVARHVGTIPAGAVVLPAFSSVKTAFAPAATIDIGSQATPGLFMGSAAIAPGTIANVPNVMGAGMGLLLETTPVFVLMGGAQATAGVGSFVIPFIVHKD